MANSKIIQTRGLTFDDVLLLPDYSEILPHQVETKTRLTKNININIPLISAAMDTVTGANMAIAMAREGGAGIIHRNNLKDEQAAYVKKVKRAESEMIADPICLTPEHTLADTLKVMEENNISGVPIVDSFENKRLVGIITSRDLRLEEDFSVAVSLKMRKEGEVIKAPLGTTMREAEQVLAKYKVEKLPIVDEQGILKGLITMKDILHRKQFPDAVKDSKGRLLAAAAIGVGEGGYERAAALVEAGADILVVDTAHGHSARVLETLSMIKEKFQNTEIIAGNIATPKAALALIKAGADAIKIGIGPGSICTTRIVAGIGVPQITAIMECARVAKEHGVPVIADGGIRYSGDIAKALAAGADSVMIGGALAGAEESPGERVISEGRVYKEYRGMGSEEAMASLTTSSSRERYGQENMPKPIAEGIEGRVPYKGTVKEIVYQMVGGLKAGMAYCGCPTISDLQENAHFMEVSPSSVIESHPHDVVITKEARNYSR
jgi:IMP dehydrogenase